MVSIGISEFTFGFAYLYELTTANWDNITAAPILPSLQQEAGQGWDAKLPLQGTAFFYQFKLTEYLSRPNATYIKDGTYDGPYFRIGLHRRDNNLQHRRLRELCQTNPQTFYVAPEVTALSDFNDAFLEKSIIPNSRTMPVADCDDIEETDNEQHYITFQAENPTWIFHSSPKKSKRSYHGEEVANLYRTTAENWVPLNMAFANELLDRTIHAVKQTEERERTLSIVAQRRFIDDRVAEMTRIQVLQRVADLAATVYGATMVLVGPRPNA